MAKKHWSGRDRGGKLVEMWQEADGTWTVGVQGTSLWVGFSKEDKHIALSLYHKILSLDAQSYGDIEHFPEYEHIL